MTLHLPAFLQKTHGFNASFSLWLGELVYAKTEAGERFGQTRTLPASSRKLYELFASCSTEYQLRQRGGRTKNQVENRLNPQKRIVVSCQSPDTVKDPIYFIKGDHVLAVWFLTFVEIYQVLIDLYGQFSWDQFRQYLMTTLGAPIEISNDLFFHACQLNMRDAAEPFYDERLNMHWLSRYMNTPKIDLICSFQERLQFKDMVNHQPLVQIMCSLCLLVDELAGDHCGYTRAEDILKRASFFQVCADVLRMHIFTTETRNLPPVVVGQGIFNIYNTLKLLARIDGSPAQMKGKYPEKHSMVKVCDRIFSMHTTERYIKLMQQPVDIGFSSLSEMRMTSANMNILRIAVQVVKWLESSTGRKHILTGSLPGRKPPMRAVFVPPKHHPIRIGLTESVDMLMREYHFPIMCCLIMTRNQMMVGATFEMSLYNTIARTMSEYDDHVGLRYREKWVLAPFPHDPSRFVLLIDQKVWRRVRDLQSHQLLTAEKTPELTRSEFTDAHVLVGAYYTGSRFTVTTVWANTIIAAITRDESFKVKTGGAHTAPMCGDYFRMLETIMWALFAGGSNQFKKEFEKTSMFVPSSECIFDYATNEWIGLKTPTLARGPGQLIPHMFNGLLAFLAVDHPRYARSSTVFELRNVIRARGFVRRFCKIEKRFIDGRILVSSEDCRLYNALDEWLTFRINQQQREFDPDCVDYILLDFPPYMKKKGANSPFCDADIDRGMPYLWYTMCIDVMIPLHLRYRMFFETSLRTPFLFAIPRKSPKATTCLDYTTWTSETLRSTQLLDKLPRKGHHHQQHRTASAAAAAAADVDDSVADDSDAAHVTSGDKKFTILHFYFSSIAQRSHVRGENAQRLDARTMPIHNEESVSLMHTLCVSIMGGSFEDVPPIFSRDYPYVECVDRWPAAIRQAAALRLGTRRHRFNSDLFLHTDLTKRAIKYAVSSGKSLKRDMIKLFALRESCAAVAYTRSDQQLLVGRDIFMVRMAPLSEEVGEIGNPMGAADKTIWKFVSSYTRNQFISQQCAVNNSILYQRELKMIIDAFKTKSFHAAVNVFAQFCGWFAGYSMLCEQWVMGDIFVKKILPYLSNKDMNSLGCVCVEWRLESKKLHARGYRLPK